MKYKSVIGLEIHIELKTKTKMFCGCLNGSEEKQPNLNVCPVCLGHPGALPVINKEAVRSVLKLGYALNAKIADISKFDRKNYFYPDLPKGYQISQFDLPLVNDGFLDVYLPSQSNNSDLPPTKKIRIKRVHLEEDAGKLIHSEDGKNTFVDFNRAGVPLAELVTEPDISSAEEARRFGEELQAILRYLGIANADMERGELRCEVNISLMKPEDVEFGTKVEIKNLNSFRAVEQSIAYEIRRQSEILENGEKVIHETRGWNEAKGETVSQRRKEEAHDYRYFPEPDLPPLVIPREWVESIAQSMPELPQEAQLRLMERYGLPAYDVSILTSSPEYLDFFDRCVAEYAQPKAVANWMMGELNKYLNQNNTEIDQCKILPEQLAALLKMVDEGSISGKMAKDIFAEMFSSGKDAATVVKEKGLAQISDQDTLIAMIEEVLKANPKVVEDYRGGKQKAAGFLVGQVMKATKGQANPALVNQLIDKCLSAD